MPLNENLAATSPVKQCRCDLHEAAGTADMPRLRAFPPMLRTGTPVGGGLRFIAN